MQIWYFYMITCPQTVSCMICTLKFLATFTFFPINSFRFYQQLLAELADKGSIKMCLSWIIDSGIFVSSWIMILTVTSPGPPSIQSQGARSEVKPPRHGLKLPFLDASGFYLLFWEAHIPSRVSDDGQGVGINCPNLVLSIQLTPQQLS